MQVYEEAVQFGERPVCKACWEKSCPYIRFCPSTGREAQPDRLKERRDSVALTAFLVGVALGLLVISSILGTIQLTGRF